VSSPPPGARIRLAPPQPASLLRPPALPQSNPLPLLVASAPAQPLQLQMPTCVRAPMPAAETERSRGRAPLILRSTCPPATHAAPRAGSSQRGPRCKSPPAARATCPLSGPKMLLQVDCGRWSPALAVARALSSGASQAAAAQHHKVAQRARHAGRALDAGVAAGVQAAAARAALGVPVRHVPRAVLGHRERVGQQRAAR